MKDTDAEVVVQLAPEGPTTPVVPFAANGPTITDDPISNASPVLIFTLLFF